VLAARIVAAARDESPNMAGPDHHPGVARAADVDPALV